MSLQDDLRTVWHALAKDDRPDAPVLAAFSRIANVQEALERIASMSPSTGNAGWLAAVNIARNALSAQETDPE